MAVDPNCRGIILRSKLHPSDVRQEHSGAGRIRFYDDVAELIGSLQPRLGRHGGIEHLALRLRHSADFAGRDVDILVLNGGNDVAGHQLEARQLGGIEPDAHRILRAEDVDVADARNARQIVLNIAREPVRNVDVRGLVGLVINADDHQEVGRPFGHGHALLLNLLREPRDRLLHFVLDLDLGDVRIDALVEHGGDRGLPARARGRAEIEQAVEARERLLDHLRDAALEGRRRGAGIGRTDVDLGRRDVRILPDRQ